MVALAGDICSRNPGFDAAYLSVDRAWEYQQHISSTAGIGNQYVDIYFTKANSMFNTETSKGLIQKLNSQLNNDMQN